MELTKPVSNNLKNSVILLFCEADVESSDNYLTSKDNYDKMNMLDTFIKEPVHTQVVSSHNSIIRLVCAESLTELEFDEDE
jgi:hypothetical protein